MRKSRRTVRSATTNLEHAATGRPSRSRGTTADCSRPVHAELGRDDTLPAAVCCLSETKDACYAMERAGIPPAAVREDPRVHQTCRNAAALRGHHRDWVDACKGGPAASANFEYGRDSTELVMLGIVSLRSGRKLAWDADAMQVRGLPEAAALLKETYRSGWEIA